MGKIAKVLRWFFGFEALVFGSILPHSAWRLWYAYGAGESVFGRTSAALLNLALTVILAMAWWNLRSGKNSARRWGIAASAINIPFGLAGLPTLIATVAGIAGLVVFSRRWAMNQISAKVAKPVRLPGDGTSGAADKIAFIGTIIVIAVGGSWWFNWADKHHLPALHGFFFSVLLIQLAMVITTAVHELGHALAALALNMKVRHWRVEPCEVSMKQGTWKLRFHAAGLLIATGGVGAAPVSLEDLRWRNIFVYAAGPLFSLWLGVLALGATLSAKGRPWEAYWELLSYIATFSLLAFVFNLVPMGTTEGQYSDGARIYQLLSSDVWRDVSLVFSMVTSTLVSPLRPRDMDICMIERASAFLCAGKRAFLLRSYAWMHYFDSGRTPEAVQAIDGLESVYTQSAFDLPVDLHMEAVFANAFVKGDAAAARRWWERMEAKKNAMPNAQKEERNLMQSSADYWKANCSLLLVEGRVAEAETAWKRGSALAVNRPSAGAYDFDRDCFAHLRQALAACQPQCV